jgi:hypothetical protein
MFSQDVLTTIRSIFAKKKRMPLLSGLESHYWFSNTTKKQSHFPFVASVFNIKLLK